MPITVESVEPAVEASDQEALIETELPFSVGVPEGPIGQTPHSLMDDSVFEIAGEDRTSGPEPASSGAGMDFGARVQEFAEAYAKDGDRSPSNDHEARVAAFLDGLSGSLAVEGPVVLPLDVDGKRVTLSGVVDLVCETTDRVFVVDYKTDSSRRAHSEYRKQLSVYYHVLEAWYPEKTVTASIFYTASAELVQIEPLAIEELQNLLRERR